MKSNPQRWKWLLPGKWKVLICTRFVLPLEWVIGFLLIITCSSRVLCDEFKSSPEAGANERIFQTLSASSVIQREPVVSYGVDTDAQSPKSPLAYSSPLQAISEFRQKKFHPGRILVKPLPGKAVPMAGNLIRGLKVNAQFASSGGTHLIELPTEMTVEEAIRRLKSSGFYQFVEPDYILHAAGSDDPYYEDGTLWGLNNYGQRGGTAGIDIAASAGWKIRSAAPDVIVAVIDSGIRHTHVDLASNMWINPREIPGNNIDVDGNGYVDDVYGIYAINSTGSPIDDYGHGTTVAGIIGATGNNERAKERFSSTLRSMRSIKS